MELPDRVPVGPEQRSSKRSVGLLVGEDPADPATDETGASWKRFRPALALSPPPADEGAQLGLEKGLLLPVLYFFFPRAP